MISERAGACLAACDVGAEHRSLCTTLGVNIPIASNRIGQNRRRERAFLIRRRYNADLIPPRARVETKANLDCI